MRIDRRNFLRIAGLGAAGGLAATGAQASSAQASVSSAPSADAVGMLVDTTECIGCRKCEWACNKAHELTDKPLTEFEDTSVFAAHRQMSHDAYTVVNKYANPDNADKPIYVKTQCMHCLEPACVSACLVTALHKEPNGAVTYDAKKCMGCRYCMVACPFEVPAYEYHNAFTPQVRKCTFCMERVAKEGGIPACAEMCPPMCLTFGKRSELLSVAHAKITRDPDRYYPKVYGEEEVGGTSWLYLASQPFEKLGFLNLGSTPIPKLTETIQHSIFKFGLPPVLLFGLLGTAMKMFKGDGESKESGGASDL